MMTQDDVMIDIKAMLEKAKPPVTDDCCIYKVPFSIRRINEDVYTPKVVSIGPFHHNRHSHLQNMEIHKLVYCKAFLQRTQTSLDSWIRYIEGVEPRFRHCYSDTLEFSKEELVKIILVDSGFILELFYRNKGNYIHRNDICISKQWLDTHIRLDLLLLENQLPFFVLKGLFDLSSPSTSVGANNNVPSLLELMFDYFGAYNRSKLNFDNISISHFTDLLRSFHLQPPPRPDRVEKYLKHFPSATELTEAGLRFKVNTENKCLLDLKFSGHALEIPQLDVDDLTELLFRNMVALEQCHYPDDAYITDYVKVLDVLVNTSKDVDLLVQNRVLVNWLGNTDNVAKLFNGLMQNVTESNVSANYLRIRQDLNAFYRNPWNNLKSTLRHDYCRSPWQTAASIAGILLLFLSLVQSICSVWQVRQGIQQ